MKNTTAASAGVGFHHVAIRALDFDATVKFYTTGLGFQEKITWGTDNSRAVLLDTGDGNYLEIFAGRTKLPESEGAILHMAFRTDNCDAALQRAVAAGAVVTMAPQDVRIESRPQPTPVRIAFCTGLDGEVIEFFQNELT